MAEAQLQFGLDLVQNLYGNGTAPLLVSPISIVLALSLAYLGSEGETRREFQKRFDVDEKSEHLLYDYLGDFMRRSKMYDSLSKVWTHGYSNSDYEIQTKYQLNLLKLYGTRIDQLNFSKPAICAKRINDDVSFHTNNNIKDIVNKGMFTRDTPLFLVSTIHFKANWCNQFDRSTKETFYSSENEQKKVNMMYLDATEDSIDYFYGENEHFTMIRMPYAKNKIYNNFNQSQSPDVYFSILLPKEKFGLKKAMRSLNGTSLSKLLNNTEYRHLIIEMPSFNLEYEKDIAFILPALGLPQDLPNFGGIMRDGPIYIKNVIHKTKIKVTKSGTEASAATVIRMFLLSYRSPVKLTRFRADHPFLYLISTKQNDILFLGIYN